MDGESHSPYPGASAFTDRHGRRRWRFRRRGKTVSLPGQPGDAAFEAAYAAAILGQAPPRPATLHPLPTAALPNTLGAAWRRVEQSPDWRALDPVTRAKNVRLAEDFLSAPVAPGQAATWRSVPVADLKRRHLKDILAANSATPHKAKHLLTAIRKMILAALDEEWIEVDPSYKLKWRPGYRGWKAWPADYLALYQQRWPPGSKQRLVFALAFWLGHRAGDIATLRHDARCTRQLEIRGETRQVDGFMVRQAKTGKALFLPIAPALAEVLAATPVTGDFVLMTAHGRPHSKKSLTNDMAAYTAAAGIPPGHTLHGLRKSLGRMLAEGGASTRQLMEMLGHDDIEHAELYSREAEQALLATEGLDKVIALHRRQVG
jgi:integrase